MRGSCLVCRRAFDAAVVQCSNCDTPYHPECLSYAGRCAVYGCAQPAVEGERKLPRVVVGFDTPQALLAVWLAGGLGFLGLAVVMQGRWQGLVMLALCALAAAVARNSGEQRVVDAKSRMIWRESSGRAEPLVAFDACRALRFRKQNSLQNGRDNYRFMLELEAGGSWFVLGDDVDPEVAGQVGQLLSLVPQRV